MSFSPNHADHGPSSGSRRQPWLLSRAGIHVFAQSCAGVFLLLFLATRWLAVDGLDPNGNPLAPDLAQFYVAGQMVLEGEADRLYDAEYVWDKINATLGVDDGTGTSYFYPPYVAWLSVPLALLPYTVAAWLYLIFSLALGFGLGWWVARELMELASPEYPEWHEDAITACWLLVASVPFWRCVLFGQNGLIWLLVTWRAYRLARREKWFRSGLVLAFGACKPQVFLGLFLWLAVTGGWRARAGLALGGVLLAALGSLGGWQLWGEWLGSLGMHQDAAGSSARMHDLHNLLKPWWGDEGIWSPVGIVELILVGAIAGGTLWAAARLWWRERRINSPWALGRLDSASHQLLALLVLAFAVAGPRTYQYDLVLLYPLLVGWWAWGRKMGKPPVWAVGAIVVATFLTDFFVLIGMPILTVIGIGVWLYLCHVIVQQADMCNKKLHN